MVFLSYNHNYNSLLESTVQSQPALVLPAVRVDGNVCLIFMTPARHSGAKSVSSTPYTELL